MNMATPTFLCANWNPDNTDCTKVGRYTCGNCNLLAYCGRQCQQSHWERHKTDCRSALGKKGWSPDWVQENRNPAFIGGPMAVDYGGKKYLWGNVPALDIVRLGSNEGDDYSDPLHLLFAASGDLRNVATTIAQLPACYKQPVHVTMNDHDLDVVARNAMLLLIALTVDDIDEAIDCMIHVWYSALIRPSDLSILQSRIHPLIESICEKIKNKTTSSSLGKTWTFGQRSLRLVLGKSSWDALLSFTKIPEGLTAERAIRVRKAVTLAASRKDYLDRHLLMQSPSHRVAKVRFREDGLLLPFASPRSDFHVPNPTFFPAIDTWPMRDNADPLNGWSSKEVEDTSSGPASADIYGKLFYHVRAVLRAFILRLSDLPVSFRLFQMDVSDLPSLLESGSFSRIEVANICDNGYLGIHRTLGLMVPLLQAPHINPHATLITLFMNAVEEITTDRDRKASMTLASKRLLKYLPIKARPTNPSGPDIIKFTYALDQVATYDHVFDRFIKDFQLAEVAQFLGVAMKERHTVVEKWPFKLKLRPGQPGAQEEFNRQLASDESGKERYVEWKRT